MELQELVGQVIENISRIGDEELIFKMRGGDTYRMYHEHDCCESVSIQDITGELQNLIGEPLTMAQESTNSNDNPPEGSESFTWTFYKFATIKGSVDIRWLGESNGYYSEGVSFVKAGNV